LSNFVFVFVSACNFVSTASESFEFSHFKGHFTRWKKALDLSGKVTYYLFDRKDEAPVGSWLTHVEFSREADILANDRGACIFDLILLRGKHQ